MTKQGEMSRGQEPRGGGKAWDVILEAKGSHRRFRHFIGFVL